jgi:GNAT superfamily N-acetyltransferase
MSVSEIRVRLASVNDAQMLARLRFDLRSSFHNVIESEEEFIARCTEWMQARLQNDGAWKCWIAETGSTSIGSVWVQLIEKLPNPIAESETYAYLTNFFVREEYRGKGAGTMLLVEALAWSRSKDAEVVLLRPTERSKPLYMRHGFKTADDFMELIL